MLTVALRHLEVGPAYAVWTGIGAAWTAVVGMAFLGETVSALKLLSIGRVLGGVVGLNLSGVTPYGDAGQRTRVVVDALQHHSDLGQSGVRCGWPPRVPVLPWLPAKLRHRAAMTIHTGLGAKVIGRPEAVVKVVPPSAAGRDQRAWKAAAVPKDQGVAGAGGAGGTSTATT